GGGVGGEWWDGWDDVTATGDARISSDNKPLGSRAIMLEAQPGVTRQLINPLLGQQIRSAAGRTITVGGWLWADQPGMSATLGVIFKTPDMVLPLSSAHPIQPSMQPTFVAWTFDAPEQIFVLQYMLTAGAPAGATTPTHLFLDGALIVEGKYTADQAPAFDDDSARSGVWDGRRFTNLLRNGSGEQGWPRLRPWVDQMLVKYIHRSPTQSVAALFDVR